MLFVYSITTPANTLEKSKKETILKVAFGIIHSVDIHFPPGPAGLLHIHINDALHQVFPYNTGSDFASDDTNISFREFIPSLVAPFKLKAFTWNLDDTFEHIVTVRLGILPPRVVAPWLLSFDEQVANAFGGG